MAIAHTARMKRWRHGWLIPAILLSLLVIDYLPHGSATQDQRDYPKTIDALAAADGQFTVMPFGYSYIDTMRFAPIHGKPLTAGYVARDTLFGRPVQHMTIHLLSSLLTAHDKAADSPRIARMTESVHSIFRAANIGAILYLGSEKRLNTLTTLLGGNIIAREGDHAAILLPQTSSTASSLTINADNWPPMPAANLGGGTKAEQLWTGFGGFRLAIPNSLMPEEAVELNVSSALRDMKSHQHFLLVNANGSPVARIELSHESTTYTVRLPANIRRLPMNVLSFTQELGSGEQSSPLPFEINALSGNRQAGNFSALYIDGQELLPYKHRSAALILATVDENGSPKMTEEFFVNDDRFASRLESAFRAAATNPWVVIMTCGEINPVTAELIEKNAVKAGIELDRREIRAHSFVAIWDMQARNAIIRSAREGYIHVINGSIENPAAPTINIKEITFR